jgi:hypothetical protein
VSALSALIQNPNTTAGGTESGVSLTTLTSAPSEEQMASLCDSDACVSLLEAVLATDPADCTLPIGAKLLLRSQLIDPVVAYCTANGVEISAGSSTGDATVGSSSTAPDSSNSTGDVDVGTDDGTDDGSPSGSTSTDSSSSTGGAVAVTTAVGATIAVALSVTGALL